MSAKVQQQVTQVIRGIKEAVSTFGHDLVDPVEGRAGQEVDLLPHTRVMGSAASWNLWV